MEVQDAGSVEAQSLEVRSLTLPSVTYPLTAGPGLVLGRANEELRLRSLLVSREHVRVRLAGGGADKDRVHAPVLTLQALSKKGAWIVRHDDGAEVLLAALAQAEVREQMMLTR